VPDAAAELSFPQCYVCGSENPAGLHVTFARDGDAGCRAEYVARPEHAGWPGLIHGGLLFTLMDEAVAWAVCYAGLRGVTARGDVQFRRPVTVGSSLVITGKVVESSRRLVRTHAEIREAGAGRALVAELDARMYLTDVAQWQREGPAGPEPAQGRGSRS
jgi:uncharacterized protein (TIGR00369 family)